MVNHKLKFNIFKVDEGKNYICEIKCVDKDKYYAYDVEDEFLIESLDTTDIVELMFMGKIERSSELTGRVNLFIEAIE